jgi:hypothetical protein
MNPSDAWKRTAGFSRDLALRPSRALAAVLAEGAALPESLRLYFVFLAASIVFYTFKPAGFPPLGPGAPPPADGGLAFWAKVEAWSPVLVALWVCLCGVFTRLLSGPGLPLRLLAASAYGVVPGAWLLVYANSAMPRWAFGLGCAALAAAAAWPARRVEGRLWRPLASWLAAVSSLGLATLPAQCAAVLLDWPAAYQAVEILLLFWSLGLATYGVSRVASLPAARAFFAVFLATLCQLLSVFALYLLGLLPKAVLKALMAA